MDTLDTVQGVKAEANIESEVKTESKEIEYNEDKDKSGHKTMEIDQEAKVEATTKREVKNELKVMEYDGDTDKINSLSSLGPFIVTKDNSQNTVYITDISESCKKQPCMLGVDEAGRGPVLGPMVYGIAFCPLEKQQVLVDLGCADSKQLTEEKRDIIFDDLNTKDYANSCIGWAVEIISPNVISTSMNRRSKCSLNEVSMNSAIGLINSAIDAGVNIAEVYVDTVGPPEKYQEKLKTLFPQFEITVAKKADSTYPIVSAASICAKVTRDHALKVWKFPEGLQLTSKNFGSGYPGDPTTKNFLTDNVDMVFGFPRLVRFSWSTAENALLDKAYDVEFDEPNSAKPKYAGAKMTQFFKGTTKTGEVKRERCRFFKERFLDSVTDF